MIYTLRVTSGQEKIITQMLMKKAKSHEDEIYSITHVDNIKGYLFLEAVDENSAVKFIQKVKHIKGLLPKTISIDEMQKIVKATAKPAITIEVKDIVEMTSGPFKGEKAKVIKIDETKDETTVELIEVAVPIPVSVKSKMVKLYRKSTDMEEN